ncbi:MAG TPA: class I SAM-dependent methyltransferase [Kofleriaceae bacterium]|jgi:SAM-dependent methyltransferase
MIPPRLALRVTRELSFAELEARLPRDEKYLTAILIRPAGTDGFGWMPIEHRAQAGDDVLLYAIDKTCVDQINALNKEFDRHYYVPLRGLASDEHELIRTRIPARDARVLEVCCGAGRITSHLVRDGNHVVGVDFNRHCLAVAHRRDGALVDYVRGDATALPFADGSFDLACCLENSLGMMFGHATPTLAEMIRATRAGGRVIVGLREQAGRPDNYHLYNTRDGLMSVGRTFDAASVRALIEGLPAAATSRIARREDLAGASRPWGGETFYVELTVS